MVDCPSCGDSNLPEARFCGECGAALQATVRCPQCEAENPGAQKFCSACGHALSGGEATEGAREQGSAPASAVSRDPRTYTPEHLAEKILGTSTDWLGLIVERLSGQTLGACLTQHVYEPVGMIDSTFHPTEEQRARLLPLRMRAADGALQATELDLPAVPEWDAGGQGSYGSARSGDWRGIFNRSRRHRS